MTPENVEIVRSIYDAINRGDWDVAFRDAHRDFELTLPSGPFNARTQRGRTAVQRVMEDYLTAFELWVVEPEELFEAGDQVVAFVKNRIRPKDSSAELEIVIGALWTIRDCTVLSVRMFPEPEKALEAAGARH